MEEEELGGWLRASRSRRMAASGAREGVGAWWGRGGMVEWGAGEGGEGWLEWVAGGGFG